VQRGGVSSSAYYEWAADEEGEPCPARREEQQLLSEIREIHADSKRSYGSPRVTAELARQGGASTTSGSSA
jgi:hypothetical protein